MPIKGTSEVRRLTRLGKIRLGIKKESPKTHNTYPEATDYLVCPEEVKAVYGDKPTELKIVFPTEDSPQQWLKRYSLTRGLVCRGDGEKAIAQVDIKTGEIASRDSEHTTLKEVPCDREKCPAYQAKQCRPVMTLQFLMPDVPGALGVYQIDTSSFNSIVNINSSLELIKACGRVSMIPLILKLVPQQVQPDGKKKTVRVLELVSPFTFTELLRMTGRTARDIFLLPAAEEPPDDLFPEEVIGNGENHGEVDTPDNSERTHIEQELLGILQRKQPDGFGWLDLTALKFIGIPDFTVLPTVSTDTLKLTLAKAKALLAESHIGKAGKLFP
jgi:hypothetical protein